MTDGGHWARQARIARRVSLSLGTVLVLLCVLAMAAMLELDTATAATKASHRLANLYQDARYYASVEARELDSYRLERSAASKREHDMAASSLDTILTQIRGLGPVSKPAVSWMPPTGSTPARSTWSAPGSRARSGRWKRAPT